MNSTKEKLLALIAEASVEEDVFVSHLSEADKSQTGKADDWTTRDVWLHIAEWKMITGRKIGRLEIKDPTGLYVGGLEAINEEIFERLKDCSWKEIENIRKEGNRLTSENLRALSEAEINDPQAFPWLENRPLWRHVAHNVYHHSLEHMAELHLKRNDYMQAERLMVEATEGILSLTKNLNGLASFPYNLACFFALNGQVDKAIEQLQKALPARPDLRAWSKTDTDLDSLRQDERYLALINQ